MNKLIVEIVKRNLEFKKKAREWRNRWIKIIVN